MNLPNSSVFPVSISTKFILLCLILLVVSGCDKKIMSPQKKPMPLSKYGFVKPVFDKESFGFLMGNGEMGGLVLNSGLGLDKMWFADYWKNPEQRQYLPGIALTNSVIETGVPKNYESTLNISTATCSTRASYNGEVTYSTKIIFSFHNDGLIAMEVTNESDRAIKFEMILPLENFDLNRIDSFMISGKNSDLNDYNQVAWAVKSNQVLMVSNKRVEVEVPVSEKLFVFYSVATEYDDKDYLELAESNVSQQTDFSSAYSSHLSNWNGILSSIGSVIIPDSEYARWFYRSVYMNYATAGSKKFLAAETQFAYAEEDWDMHAFTYGHGSWAALSFLQFGDSLRAKRSLEWLYQPMSLKNNVHILVPDTGVLNLTYHGEKVEGARYLRTYPQHAFAFAHEQTDFGENIPYSDDSHWDLQFHLNGFAASLFHRYSKYYNDFEFEKEIAYPVIKGTAEFWSALIKKDSATDEYFLPPMLSLSENIVKQSVLDAVLAARWNLMTAAEYEKKFTKIEMINYAKLAEQLIIPQNDSIYLEFRGDNQDRMGGGYFGIRAPAYLGFPVVEHLKYIDKTKARNTIDRAWARNNYGKGMISFISNWFALTECYLGNGDNALKKSSHTVSLSDPSNTLLYEAFSYRGDSVKAKFNPYFLTGYSSLTLVPIAMMIQSYDDTLYFFPAIPSSWNHADFYDLPAEGGFRVSGIYNGIDNYEVWIKKNGELIKHLKNTPSISIHELKD